MNTRVLDWIPIVAAAAISFMVLLDLAAFVYRTQAPVYAAARPLRAIPVPFAADEPQRFNTVRDADGRPLYSRERDPNDPVIGWWNGSNGSDWPSSR